MKYHITTFDLLFQGKKVNGKIESKASEVEVSFIANEQFSLFMNS